MRELLRACALPEAGLGEPPGTVLLVAKGADRLVACGALEPYGRYALLRSVAVSDELRGHGLGARITEAILKRAAELGLDAVYLLTTTAPGFFARLGFEELPRSAVPEAIAGSLEFSSICPASAVAMVRSLRGGGSPVASTS